RHCFDARAHDGGVEAAVNELYGQPQRRHDPPRSTLGPHALRGSGGRRRHRRSRPHLPAQPA
ncbi:hypothetical protein HK405_000055, partial [Cladochytrium tenue]